MKRLYTLLTSASLLLAFAGGVLPQDFVQTVSAAEQAQDDAEKTGSIVLDEKTGTLTLSGNITAAEVQKYAKNEAVRAVVAAEGCVFPAYCSGMFKNFCAESIDISKADTSEVYSMDRMFVTCSNLKTVNLSGINTSDVEHMEGMFFACSNLTELDMSMLDTSNVRCMDNMFSHCENLTKLNLSGIDTAKVEDTTCMFWNCGLKELDLSGFHTPSLKNMYGMFTECGALKTLDLSGFDTSKVTDMQLCFDGCMMLEELDLSSFDTSNVQLMTQMFRSCRNLETIYCGEKWNLSSLEGKTKMFEDCKLLTGGNGTVYSDEHIDSEYARIDTADAPGYLTFKEKPTPQADWGNANCAEEVDVSDAVLVARYVAEDTGANLTAQGKINADVTHDGNITGDDTILILRYIAKMVTLADLEP